MDVPAELDLAREAHRCQEWAGAYARFTAVDRVAPLDAGDVELLAESAELIDHGDEAVLPGLSRRRGHRRCRPLRMVALPRVSAEG